MHQSGQFEPLPNVPDTDIFLGLSDNRPLHVFPLKMAKALENGGRGDEVLRPNSEFCDVKVEFGTDHQMFINVQKAVLAACSTVFKAILTTKMTEMSQGVIKMDPQIPTDAVLSFFNLIYDLETDSLMDQVELSLEILKLAHRYQVTRCVDVCVGNIVCSLSESFSLKVFLKVVVAGDLMAIPDLVFRCFQVINRNLECLFTPEGKAEYMKFLKENSTAAYALTTVVDIVCP